VLGCAALTLGTSACRSTQQESAQIDREGRQSGAGATPALKLGKANHAVLVSDVTLLSSAGRTALVARLTATSARSQSELPVLATLTGAGGKLLYSNGTGGIEASLQHMGQLPPHQSAWWVDDQVLSAEPGGRPSVRVGSGATPTSGSPATLSTVGLRTSEQAGISVVSGTLVNRSARAQSRVPVYAVALRVGRVVAAGRAVVGVLVGHVGASVPFQVFLVGNPAGATLQLNAVPSA
jgi:hypothetical protein